MLRKPVELRAAGCRLMFEADGSVRSFESLRERRLLFGREQVWFYKVQAGVTVQAQKPDWSFRVQPKSAGLAGRVFDSIEVAQTIEFLDAGKEGYLRTVKVRNLGTSPTRLKIIAVWDPTAAQFRERNFPWGSLGVNAFNRGSHVAMDEVSDPPSARVVGAIPQPQRFYMTTERGRATDAVQTGEVPEGTAGMSGQALIVSLHEIELEAQETGSFTFASIYHATKLEDALAEFAKLQQSQRPTRESPKVFSCSSPQVTRAFAWALAALEGVEYEDNVLDLCEVLRGLEYVEPASAVKVISALRTMISRVGALSHSQNPGSPGILESSVYLSSAARYLVLSGDKKLARSMYPQLRKVANMLMESSVDAAVRLNPDHPNGWRRLLGKGYPTGEVPEVSLALSSALTMASQLARLLAKGSDGGRFRERADMVLNGVRKRLTDERGMLALSLDLTGKLHFEDTIDSAVAWYRCVSAAPESQTAAHRLLENDFEAGYGPRTVPTSNRNYFNGTYGQGQLGGYWTRAALAHAILCYHSGLSGTGSLMLEKVGKLSADDAVRFGGNPGEFPYWVDVEGKEIHGEKSDPVAASRFIEAVVEGELGFSTGPGPAAFSPALSSSLRWLAGEFWVGSAATVFVGRSAGKVSTFVSGVRGSHKNGFLFAKSEPALSNQKDLTALSFHGPGQVVCVGNASPNRIQSAVSFTPRAEELSKKLSSPLEEFDPSKETWTRSGILKVAPTMSFDVTVGPGEWKAFRVSTA